MNIEDLYPDIICPISKQIMINPVITNMGISYERKDILEWINKKNNCPVTGEYLDSTLLIPNIQLKNTIIVLQDKFLFHTNNTTFTDDNKCCIIL